MVSGRFWLGSGGFGSFRVGSDGFGWVRVVSGFINNVLFVETTELFISNSVRVYNYTDTFVDTLSQGWGFSLPVLFRDEDFCAQ